MPELSTFGTRCSPLLASHSKCILSVYFGSWSCRRNRVLPRPHFFLYPSTFVHGHASVHLFFFGCIRPLFFFFGCIRPLLFMDMHPSTLFFLSVHFFSWTCIRPLFYFFKNIWRTIYNLCHIFFWVCRHFPFNGFLLKVVFISVCFLCFAWYIYD